MYYLTKSLHLLCALASFALFFLRGIWMLRGSAQLSRGWVRVLPHGIDTLLLASAVALTLLTRQYPLTQDWLNAKVLALPVYIGLGMLALRPGRSRRLRAAAWVGALAVFLYVVSVALSRDPVGVFRLVI